jgi:hypothetical protein
MSLIRVKDMGSVPIYATDKRVMRTLKKHRGKHVAASFVSSVVGEIEAVSRLR